MQCNDLDDTIINVDLIEVAKPAVSKQSSKKLCIELVLNSGNKWTLFYANESDRNADLDYMATCMRTGD